MASSQQHKEIWKERLLQNYKTLVHDTDLYRASDECLSKEVFTLEEKEQLDIMPGTAFDKNRQFLKILLHKSETIFERFLECLTAEHSEIKQMITDTKVTDIPNRTEKDQDMMNLKGKIFRNYDKIACMTSLHDFSDDFVSRRIFEICDWEKITNITLSTTERSRKFLDILLATKSHGCMLLLDLLVLHGHGNLVREIKETDVNEYVDKEIEAHVRKIQKDILNKSTRERSALELQTIAMIDRHKADKTFVVTKAVEKGIEVLTEHGILIYSGLPGDGKILNAFEVMAHFKGSHPDWMFLELDDVRDWKTYIDLSVDSVILLDDCLGSSNTDTNLIKESEKYWPNIHACIGTGKVKVIMTIRKNIFAKNRSKLEKYKIFSKDHRVKLTSDKMKLTKDVKLQILKRHFDNNIISICKNTRDENYKSADNKTPIKISERTVSKIIDTDPLIGFPQTCFMFCNDRKYTQLGVKYFRDPSQSLIDEIKSLIDLDSKQSEKVQYCIMCYMLLKGEIIDIDELDTDMFKKVVQSVQLFPEPRPRDINDNIERLINIYIVRKGDNQLYEFKHQTILESVALCFYEDNVALLIELCSKDFIVEFIRPQKYHKTKGEIVLKLKEKEYPFLIQRFMYSLQHDEGIERYRWWVKHPILDDRPFVECIISAIESNSQYKYSVEGCIGGDHGLYALADIYDKQHFKKRISDEFKIQITRRKSSRKRTSTVKFLVEPPQQCKLDCKPSQQCELDYDVSINTSSLDQSSRPSLSVPRYFITEPYFKPIASEQFMYKSRSSVPYVSDTERLSSDKTYNTITTGSFEYPIQLSTSSVPDERRFSSLQHSNRKYKWQNV